MAGSRALVKNWQRRFPDDVLKLARKLTSLARDGDMDHVDFEVHDVAKFMWKMLRPDEFATEYAKGGPVVMTWAQYKKLREREEGVEATAVLGREE